MAETWLLGIEIGGTKLQLGIGRGDGNLVALERLRVDPSRGAADILEQIATAVPALLERSHLERNQIEAIGIGFGGPVDTARGRTQRSYQVAGWDDFPLTAWLSDHLGVRRVFLENDADAAGLAECRWGAGVGFSPVLYVTVGSGIGGALIVDDRIYRGAGHGATEIGHLQVFSDNSPGAGPPELEKVASGWGIAAAARDVAEQRIGQGRGDWIVLAGASGDPSRITASIVAEAAAAGDPDACSILERARASFAFALTQAIALLAPRRIVIGGGVALIGDLCWFDPIRRLVDRNVFASFRGHYDIMPAILAEEVVVHGAIAIARDALLGRPPAST